MQKAFKRSISILLSLVMILSTVVVAGNVFFMQAEAQTPAGNETVTTVVACSDYQYRNSDVYGVGATGNAGGQIVVGNIVTQMQNAGISKADGFLCCGDYDYDLGSGADVTSGVASLKSAVSPITDGNTNTVLVQGNHDPQSTAGGTSPSGDNDPADGAYGVFVINERDYQWGQRVDESATLAAAENLRRYFNDKIAVDYTAPIFVISHLPLHYSMRTNQDGDNIYAKDLFDVLQDGADHGLNIIYLFGHNHSNGWDDYLGGPKVFLTPGEDINIAEPGSRTAYTVESLKFVYMNAGYTGYWERYNTATAAASMNFNIDDLSMTTFTISDSDVVINRYNTTGATNLKNAGMRNWHKNEQNLSPAYPVTENTVSSPYTLTLTSAVDDTEYEIDPVVHKETGSTGDVNAKIYPRITDASQLVDGGTYLFVLSGSRNGTNVTSPLFLTDRQQAHGVSGGNNEADGLIADAAPAGFENGDSAYGNYAAYEWTLRESGTGWVLCSDKGEVTLSGSADYTNYFDVRLTENGTPLSFTSFSTRPQEFFASASLSYNGGTAADRFLNYSATVFGYANHRNNATFAIYGTKSVSGTITEPHADRSQTPATYLRITDVSQLVNGGNYVLIIAGMENTSSEYTEWDNKYLLNHSLKTASSLTGFDYSSAPFSDAISNSITGAYGAYEFQFNASGNKWILSDATGQVTMTRYNNTSSFNVSYTSSGTPFTISPASQNGLFQLTATVSSIELILDHNSSAGIINAYRKTNSGNRATFAIYGTKKDPDTTIQRYVKEVVNTTSDLDEGETYVIVNGTNAINPANDLRAIPVPVHTDENGNKYLDYGNHDSLEFTWKRYTDYSQRLDFVNGSNQKLQVSRSGEEYITSTTTTTSYDQVSSFANDGVYVIVNNGYALTAASANTNNTRLTRTAVTVNGNTVTANNYNNIEWTFTNNKLKANSGQFLNFTATSGISLQDTGSNIEYTSAGVIRYNRGNNRYYNIRNNSDGYFDRSGSNSSAFTLYKKNVTTTTTTTLDPSCIPNLTYSVGMGSDVAQYLTLEGINTTNHTAKILLHSNEVGDDTTYSRYIGEPVQTTGYMHFSESDTGADFEFYKLQNVVLPGEVHEPEAITEDAANNSPIESITLSANEATLYVGASPSTYTGLYFIVRYKTDAKAVTEEQIPIKVGDLIDYTGHHDVASYCGEPGTLYGLGAYYDGADGNWFSNLILHLIEKEDYPEYPNEGSVKVNKTSGAPNFLTNGVTQVELSATGVPMTPGVDIVLMLDTSSSMSNTVNGVTRLDALRNSVAAMLEALSKPNETTGMAPDISMAIADFNGYYDTSAEFGTTDTYVSRDDVPNGTTPRTTTNTAQHCTVLTGPNAGTETYDSDAFIPVSELTDTSAQYHFDAQSISLKSGTNYDQALETVYKLFEARQAYNAAHQQERETVVIFMSDGGPFQYNYFTSQSTTYLWNYWLMGTYDESAATLGTPVANETNPPASTNADNNDIYRTYLNNHNDLTELKADYNNGGHWYFYNGKGNPNRYAEALKGDKDKFYTVLTKDPDAYCNDRNSDGFCDLCGKCTEALGVTCADHDHDGYCDACGHLDQCVHADGNNDGFCDICGECMDGCKTYQYMTQVSGLGATVYSIMFCKMVDKQISTDVMDHIIKDIASDDSKAYPDAQSAEDLTQAFLDIASNFVQAGTGAYFLDTMGAAYDMQLARVFTKNNGEFEQTYTLDPAPTIEVKKYKVYTRADYDNHVISDYNMIGTRTGQYETIEVVSFNDNGTQGFSNQINSGGTNIIRDNVIYAKNFIYNNNSMPVMIDTDGDGVTDFSLPAETFYWTIGIIEDTEYALSYWLYLTGSMEGTRDPGSFQTNSAAVLWYDNYLGHECYQEVPSPAQAWLAATITYEFYLVDDLGNPVNSAGEIVPFANRVLIGNPQSETFNLNSNDMQTAQDHFQVAAASLPDCYELYNPDAKFAVALYSGDDYNTSRAIITDDVNVYGSNTAVTTYYYDQYNTYNQAGDVPSNKVYDYANTHVAFGVKRIVTIVPDTVVIDYGLPVKIHVLQNDIALIAGSRINAIGAQLAQDAELNIGYPETRLSDSAKTLTLAHGTAGVVNGDTSAETYVMYTPADMQMAAEETFYYEVYMNSHYYYSTVTVIPAANIYYEDSFLKFNDGTGADATYTWKTAGETYENVFQAEDRPGTFALSAYDANNVYGNDAAYDDNVATYSLGSARYVSLDGGCSVSGTAPTAEFTFCGTGFDVISVTRGDTGIMAMTIQNLETGKTKRQIINTYYGYSYGQLYLTRAGSVTLEPKDSNGDDNMLLYYYSHSFDEYTPKADPDEYLVRVNGRVFSTKDHSGLDGTPYDVAYGWIVQTTANSGLYQIPVVKIKNLEYGTYKVTLQPRYASSLDEQGLGHYDVYVDGIRIYDPAGTGENVSTVVAEAYEADFERDPILAEVRDTVIADPDNFLKQTAGVGETDQPVGGSVMVDGMSVTAGSTAALTNMVQAGPNNEMYLAQYQAIAFKPTVIAEKAPASFQLGMKVAITKTDEETGELIPSNASLRVIISDVKKQAIKQIYSMTVSGSAEQFYDLSPLLSWTKEENSEKYVCDYDIVILNDSNVVLSLTTFKVTFSSLPDEELPERSLELSSSRRTFAFAAKAVNKVLTSADDSTLEIKWNSTDLAVGAEAVLTVTTSNEITSVMIGDIEVTDYTQNDDGTRTWTYEFVVQENGADAYDVILKDAFGRTSEFSTKVPVEEIEAPDTTGEADETDPTDGEDSGSNAKGLRRIWNWLINLFRKIISFFKVGA